MQIRKILLGMFLAASLAGCTGEPVDTTPYTLGNPNAPITIVEFADLQCPACGVISPQVSEIVKRNPDKVRLEFWHYPLSHLHNHAQMAAEAAECAGDQGKFWEYVDLAFKNQKDFSEEFFKQAAKDVGANEVTFNQCLDERDKRGKVLAHLREAKRLQAPGTPTLFINGELVQFPGAEALEEYLLNLAN